MSQKNNVLPEMLMLQGCLIMLQEHSADVVQVKLIPKTVLKVYTLRTVNRILVMVSVIIVQ